MVQTVSQLGKSRSLQNLITDYFGELTVIDFSKSATGLKTFGGTGRVTHMLPDFNGIQQQFCDRGGFSTGNRAGLRCLKTKSDKSLGQSKSFQYSRQNRDSACEAMSDRDIAFGGNRLLNTATRHPFASALRGTDFCHILYPQQTRKCDPFWFETKERPLRAPLRGKSRSP